MSTKIKPILDGHHTFTPYLSVRGASAALEFYKKAFAQASYADSIRPMER